MNTVHMAGLDMNLLLALHALLVDKHVTRAASRVGISQSAMSHALSRLRTLLDDPLFIRTSRGMVPTPRAQEIAEPLSRALDEIGHALARRSVFDPRQARRTFTIGAGDYGELAFLPSLAALVQVEAPGVNIVIDPVPGDALAALESGRLDAMVAYGSDDWPGVYRKLLFVDRFVCVVRADHPAVKRTLSLETYVELPHVLVSPRGTGRAYIDEVLAKRGLSRHVAVRVPHFLIAPLVVARTDMVVTVPERVAKAFEGSLPLKIVKCPVDVEDVRISQMWHERVNLDPAHVWLRKAIADAAKG